MPAQASSANMPELVSLGNCSYQFAPVQPSLAAAKAFTGWRKFGLGNVQYQSEKGVASYQSAVPLVDLIDIVTSQRVTVAGNLKEINPLVMGMLLGGITPIVTVKASSPASTTVAATPTPTAKNFSLASTTGYAKSMLIRHQAGTINQFGYIDTINGSAVSLREPLSQNIAPAGGDAIAAVASMDFLDGTQSLLQPVSLRIVHSIAGSPYATFSIYLFKTQPSGNMAFSFGDDEDPNKIEYPYTFKGLSDSNIENGNVVSYGFDF